MPKKLFRGELMPAVQDILIRYPETRNNVNVLCWHVWFMKENCIMLHELEHCTSAESITRAHRFLVQQGAIFERATKQEVNSEFDSLSAVSA